MYDPDGNLVDNSYVYQGFSGTLDYTSTNGTLKAGNWTFSTETGSGTYSNMDFNCNFQIQRKDEYGVSLIDAGDGVYTGSFQLKSDAVLGEYTVTALVRDRNYTFNAKEYDEEYMKV